MTGGAFYIEDGISHKGLPPLAELKDCQIWHQNRQYQILDALMDSSDFMDILQTSMKYRMSLNDEEPTAELDALFVLSGSAMGVPPRLAKAQAHYNTLALFKSVLYEYPDESIAELTARVVAYSFADGFKAGMLITKVKMGEPRPVLKDGTLAEWIAPINPGAVIHVAFTQFMWSVAKTFEDVPATTQNPTVWVDCLEIVNRDTWAMGVIAGQWMTNAHFSDGLWDFSNSLEESLNE